MEFKLHNGKVNDIMMNDEHITTIIMIKNMFMTIIAKF
jgi:hypothetical protein